MWQQFEDTSADPTKAANHVPLNPAENLTACNFAAFNELTADDIADDFGEDEIFDDDEDDAPDQKKKDENRQTYDGGCNLLEFTQPQVEAGKKYMREHDPIPDKLREKALTEEDGSKFYAASFLTVGIYPTRRLPNARN